MSEYWVNTVNTAVLYIIILQWLHSSLPSSQPFLHACLVCERVDHSNTRRDQRPAHIINCNYYLCFIWWTSTDLQDLGKLGELAAAIRGPEEAGVGKVCSVQIPHVTNPVIVFVKEDPDKVQWPKVICCQTD